MFPGIVSGGRCGGGCMAIGITMCLFWRIVVERFTCGKER